MASSSSSGGAEEFGGVIDAKFESGYVITLNMGSEKLRGVLYEPAKNPVLEAPIQNNGSAASSSTGRRRRKKSEIKKRDPSLPKLNRSAYNFFFAEKHAEVKKQNQDKHYKELSKVLGQLWTNLQESDRMVYKEMAMKDKERYKAEMEACLESEKEHRDKVVLYAVPLRQVPPQQHSHMFDADMAMNEVDDPCFLQTPHENNNGGNSYEQDHNITAERGFNHVDPFPVTPEAVPEDKLSKEG